MAGYNLNHDELDADSVTDKTKTFSIPGMPPSQTITRAQNEASLTTHAVFLQDEWELPADFLLTFGARQTWIESELDKTNGTTPLETVRDNQPVFSAGVNWNGIPNLTLRGLFSQGYRFPSLDKLYIGTSHGSDKPTLANPDLEPETSDNFEIGARYNNGAWNVDLAAYFNKAEDYITSEDFDTVSRRYANVDESESHGVEAYVSYDLKSLPLTPYFSGTWMKRKNTEGNASTYDTNTPEFSGKVGMKYERVLETRPGTVWADLFVRAATDADEKQADGTTTTEAAWQTVNFAIGSEFGESGKYQASLNLNNILDQSYRSAQNSIDEPGFHAVARVGVKF